MGMEIQNNPLQHGAKVIEAASLGTCEVAGEMLNKTIDFAGDTVFSLFGNLPKLTSASPNQGNSDNLHASTDAGLSLGQGNTQAIQQNVNGLGNLINGTIGFAGNLCQSVGNSLAQATPILSNSLMNLGTNIMVASQYMQPQNLDYYASVGLGRFGRFGCDRFARYYGMDIMSAPLYSHFNHNLGMPNFGYNNFSNIPYNYMNMGPYDYNNARMQLDQILYPEKYNNNNNNNDNNTKTDDKPKEDTTPLPESGQGKTWVSAIQDKVDKKQELTANESRLLSGYKTLSTKYSPYRVDANGNPLVDAQGKPIPSTLGKEIAKIHQLLENKKTDAVTNMLKRMPKEKRAAIEAHYTEYIAQLTGEVRNLRDDIKESCLWWGFGWTKMNTSKADKIFDMLDETADVYPATMAAALRQAVEGHRIGGFGINDDRVAKLFKKMKNNPEFKNAVLEEYEKFGSSLVDDIGKKWFISSGNSWIMNEM